MAGHGRCVGDGAGGAGVDRVFAGPLTDDLIGTDWRHDGIHFNDAGLKEHGRRWAAAILAAFDFPSPAAEPTVAATSTTPASATPSSTSQPTIGATPSPPPPRFPYRVALPVAYTFVSPDHR